MRDHLAYLKYVLRHKWYVLVVSRRFKVSLWQALLHDWSKFLPSEWSPYVKTFYKPDGTDQYNETIDFNLAWNHHQKRQPHHWQYWLLKMDRGDSITLPMPEKYIKEMVADWVGASLAITGKNGVGIWYEKNKNIMQLHTDTRKRVEELILSN